MAACAGTPIENGLIYDELRRVNQKVSVEVFQLHNLFDISRELTGSLEEETIQNLITTTVMGHFVVSRCALYLCGPRGLSLAHERGLRRDVENAPIAPEEARAALEGLRGPSCRAVRSADAWRRTAWPSSSPTPRGRERRRTTTPLSSRTRRS